MLSTDVVASRLGVSRRTVQTMCKNEEIGAVRVRHQWLIPEDVLEAFIRRGGSEPAYQAGGGSTGAEVMFRRKPRE